MEQSVRFCTTSDGVTIAYTTFGEGVPVLITPGWVTHVELDTMTPGFREFMEAFIGRGLQVIRYDGRGTGLSDRDVDDISVSARVRDIEAVVEHLGLDRLVLFGWSMSAPPAIIYAAETPDRVSHLVLYAAYARPFGEKRAEIARALLALMRAEWSIGSKTVVEFTIPGAERAIAEATAEYFRQAASVKVATALLEEGMFQTDVTSYLNRLTMPTLVLHRRDDRAVPFENGRQLAALVPDARFVPLAGDAHPAFFGDSAPLLDAIDQFLGSAAARPRAAAQPAGLQTILFTDMEGSTTLTQRLGDAAAQELIRAHNAIVRDALRAHGGSEVKHTGDGIMAAFPSASGAIECAIAIQRALVEHGESNADTPIRVRIGLNAGEPVAEEQDLFGTAVQLAARVCAHAQPGEILVSDVVRQLSAGKGFLFSDRGDVALRGFEDPVRLYEVRWEDS